MSRPLTEAEKRLATHLLKFEKHIDSRRLSISLAFGLEALAALSNAGIRIVRCDFNKDKQNYTVTLTTEEYKKYLDICCEKVGLQVLLDGIVVTKDGLCITDASLL